MTIPGILLAMQMSGQHDEELARRSKEVVPFTRGRLGGVLEKYEALVRPANLGAVTHSGAVEWPYEASIGEDEA